MNMKHVITLITAMMILTTGCAAVLFADHVDAIGSGTAADPFQGTGSMTYDVTKGAAVYAYPGTQLSLIPSSGGRGCDYTVPDGIDYDVISNTLNLTVPSTGVWEIRFSVAGLDGTITIYVVQEVEELKFTSNPSQGLTTYVPDGYHLLTFVFTDSSMQQYLVADRDSFDTPSTGVNGNLWYSDKYGFEFDFSNVQDSAIFRSYSMSGGAN